MATPSVLAFDLGTSGLKAAVVAVGGALLDTEVVPLGMTRFPGGGVEQDPNDWWNAMVRAAEQLFSRGKASPADVVGIGLSSQWGGTVACDPAGVPLRPALIWMDARGAEEARALSGGFPAIDGYGLLKIQAWLRKTGGAPSLSGKDPVGHIAWLRRHEPQTLEKAALLLEPKDWVNLKLTGRAAASFDSIALHWSTDNRQINDVKYDPALLALTKLDRKQLPELIAPAAVVGPLTAEAAKQLGLSTSVKVISGAADMHTAAIGAGTIADAQAHLCLGTSSWLLAHVPFKKTDLAHNMASLPAAIPGRYLFCNEQESAAGGLKWMVEGMLGRSGPDAYGPMLAEAAEAPAGCDGLLFLPWLHGERSPVDDRLVRGGLAGLSLTHTRGHTLRAVLEGVAQNSRWLLGHLENNLGTQVPDVTVVGGGARSDLWCQIHADVLGRPIRQVEDPQLANARGAAFQAFAGLGLIAWDEVRARIPIRRTFEPNPTHAALYSERHEQFLLEFKHRQKMGHRYPPKD
jgi:xylulokinase